MNIISIPLVGIASISFYVGLYHLFLFSRRKQQREDLAFAAMCLINVFYDIFCIGLYNVTSFAACVKWQRLQGIEMAVINIAFLWFLIYFTRQKPQKITYSLTIFYLLAAVVQSVDRSNLTILVNQPNIREVSLPFGGMVTYYLTKPGLFSNVQNVIQLLTGVYFFWIGVNFYQRGYKREALSLLIALGILYATAIINLTVEMGLLPMINLLEYGFLALIVMMAYSLSNTIVEASKVKESLIESEERYRTIVEYSHAGILTVNHAYQFTYVNDQACNILGYSREELLRKDFRQILDDESKKKGADIYVRLQRGESAPPHYETSIIRKDGEKRILEMSAAATKLPSGMIHTIGQVLDITDRKRLEHENEERRKYLESIFASVPDAVVTLDIQSNTLEWNPGAERLFGYTAEEAVGKNIDVLITGDDVSIQRKAVSWTQMMQKGVSIPPTETTRFRKDNSPVEVIASVSPILIGEEWNGVVAVYTDITERKKAEATLKESEEKYRSLFENSPESITLVGLHGIILDCNETTARISDAAREQIIGKSFLELGVLGEQDSPKYFELFTNLMRGDPPATLQVEYFLPNKLTRWVEVFPALLKKDNQAYAIQVISRDISEKRKTEAERENLIKELETRNAELERFIYIVSHDLRSPLVTIRGFLGYLEKDISAANTEQVNADMDRIATATNKMQLMLSELLKLAQIGRMRNPPEDVGFSLLAREAVDLEYMQIEARGAQVDIAENLPSVYGDRTRLLEVVQNLVDNTCKFMGSQPNPLIEIGSRGIDQDGLPIFFVRDNGIGIDPQYHERIFGIFNKLDVHTDGTGVGLAIVKRIVEEHNGRIWVESQGKGMGSTFCFTLPTSPKV